MKKEKFVFAIIILVFVIFIFTTGDIISRDQAKIQQWATDNGYLIVKSERCFWHTGPYWASKDMRIYKVDLENQKTYWFRFGLFGTDIEEY